MGQTAMIIATPNSERDVARLLVSVQLLKVKKFILANKSRYRTNDLMRTYQLCLNDYFRLNPLFEKITRKTEFNINGDCSPLIKKLINDI